MRKPKDSTDKIIQRIAAEFRLGILDDRPSAQNCFAVCAPLQAILSMYGYETELIEGEVGGCQHFWLQLPDGRIIDPTADQFKAPSGEAMPEIYIGPLPLWYFEAIS